MVVYENSLKKGHKFFFKLFRLNNKEYGSAEGEQVRMSLKTNKKSARTYFPPTTALKI